MRVGDYDPKIMKKGSEISGAIETSFGSEDWEIEFESLSVGGK